MSLFSESEKDLKNKALSFMKHVSQAPSNLWQEQARGNVRAISRLLGSVLCTSYYYATRTVGLEQMLE